jgi:hypothetical protein
MDSAFLYFETPTMHMHVGGLMLVDPSEAKKPYSFEDYREYIASRLHRVPQFRRKLAMVPLNLGKPSWVEDPDFDLDYHLHRAVVPAPGGTAAGRCGRCGSSRAVPTVWSRSCRRCTTR